MSHYAIFNFTDDFKLSELKKKLIEIDQEIDF